MGGLALKNTFTRRYERKEFETLWDEMSGILSETFSRFGLPRFYHNKESFGDMDIIIQTTSAKKSVDIREYIEETFKPNEIFHNGNAWSFDYKELQIDFINCSEEHYDSNYHYLAFNDLGNLMGRIAQKMGIKYGQEGLWYNHFYKDQKIGKIMISKDYPKIFEYLDLDYNKWVNGFDTLEEIFDYIRGSKYYTPEIFKLDQLNKINRERNAKRKSYMSFLEYIKDDNFSNIAGVKLHLHKEDVIKEIHNAFPESNIKYEVARIEYQHSKSTYAGQKFNGGMVIDRYGIEGQALGQALAYFREFIDQEYCGELMDYQDVIIKYSIEDIWNIFEIANDIVRT